MGFRRGSIAAVAPAGPHPEGPFGVLRGENIGPLRNVSHLTGLEALLDWCTPTRGISGSICVAFALKAAAAAERAG